MKKFFDILAIMRATNDCYTCPHSDDGKVCKKTIGIYESPCSFKASKRMYGTSYRKQLASCYNSFTDV